MKAALARYEAVEFAGGLLKRVQKHHSKYWDDMDDWPAGRQGYTVEWELDAAGWNRLIAAGLKAEPEPVPKPARGAEEETGDSAAKW